MLTLQSITEAEKRLKPVITRTPLERSGRLSARYQAEIYLKREDLQIVRSYKIRGAYNLMSTLTVAQKAQGVVCASAGNHAQGVALSCQLLQIKGKIFMPCNTPKQKIQRVHNLGGEWVEVELVGDTFDDTKQRASTVCQEKAMTFVHPFDDLRVIAGQATVAMEIFEQSPVQPDLVIAPIGGGGLMSGLSFYSKNLYPKTQLLGVEPAGAAAMQAAIKQQALVSLEQIDTFVDGAAVKMVGENTLSLCSQYVDRFLSVPEGKVCSTMIELYQNDGIVTEPAGALAISSLEQITEQLEGKMVVCLVSGGNNDLSRYPEIIERSLIFEGLRHYFLIEFSQRAGALRSFLEEALDPHDDIVLFEYMKKSNREFGPALVGIELTDPQNLGPLLKRMQKIGLHFERVSADSSLFRFIV